MCVRQTKQQWRGKILLQASHNRKVVKINQLTAIVSLSATEIALFAMRARQWETESNIKAGEKLAKFKNKKIQKQNYLFSEIAFLTLVSGSGFRYFHIFPFVTLVNSLSSQEKVLHVEFIDFLCGQIFLNSAEKKCRRKWRALNPSLYISSYLRMKIEKSEGGHIYHLPLSI